MFHTANLFARLTLWSNRRDEKLCIGRQPTMATNGGESQAAAAFGRAPTERGNCATGLGDMVLSARKGRLSRVSGWTRAGEGRDCDGQSQEAPARVLARARTGVGCTGDYIGGTPVVFGSKGPHP